jgi:hypothetical protein
VKFQCPYRIKDARQIGWFNCQLEDGHDGVHNPPPPPVGRTLMVEGIWHRPGEKSTADPEIVPIMVPWCQEIKSSEGSKVQSQARSNK